MLRSPHVDIVPDHVALQWTEDGDEEPIVAGPEIGPLLPLAVGTKTPKVLLMSLEAMYKTVEDAHETNAELCCRLLQSMLTYLEAMRPGEWVAECENIVECLFRLLLGISQQASSTTGTGGGSGIEQTQTSLNRSQSMSGSLRARCLTSSSVPSSSSSFRLGTVATAALFCLAVAKGHPGMLLAAANSVLVRSGIGDDDGGSTADCCIPTPALVMKMKQLADSATSPTALLFSHDQEPCLIRLPDPATKSGQMVSSGTYIFWLTSNGLLKIGTGFNGSIKGIVYQTNKDLAKFSSGWIGLVCNTVLLHPSGPIKSWLPGETVVLHKVCPDDLRLTGHLQMRLTAPGSLSDPDSRVNQSSISGQTAHWRGVLFSEPRRLGCCLFSDDNKTGISQSASSTSPTGSVVVVKHFKMATDNRSMTEESEHFIDISQNMLWSLDWSATTGESEVAVSSDACEWSAGLAMTLLVVLCLPCYLLYVYVCPPAARNDTGQS